MNKIIDYYKNSKYYLNNLKELIPLNIDNYKVDNDLKQLVQIYDELTFEKRNILDTLSSNINYIETSLSFDINDDLNISYFYDIYNNFIIELFLSEKYSIDNNIFMVKHTFTKDKNIIEIERDRLKGFCYIPSVNLINMKSAYTNEELTKQDLDLTINNLKLINQSLNNFYKNNKVLIRKKG